MGSQINTKSHEMAYTIVTPKKASIRVIRVVTGNSRNVPFTCNLCHPKADSESECSSPDNETSSSSPLPPVLWHKQGMGRSAEP